MDRRRLWILAASFGLVTIASSLRAQTTTRDVEENGVTYREYRWTVPRVIYEQTTEEQPRGGYREKVTTENRPLTTSRYVPITEYRWQPVMRNRWNPFVEPHYEYQLVPFTRWELKTETVNVPVTKREYEAVNDKIKVVVQRPRTVNEEIVRRVPIGVKAGQEGTAVAKREKISLDDVDRGSDRRKRSDGLGAGPRD